MNIKRSCIFVIIFIIQIYDVESQQIGFNIPKGESRVTIPFERYNNLIIVPVEINNTLTLKFILDTGVQYPILTEKIIAEHLGLKFNRIITIRGPGEQDSIKAHIVQNVKLALPGGVESGINQAMLVLEEDYLELSNNMGIEIYGIIGYDIFSRFIVEINFDENFITLHEPKKYRVRRSYKKVPLKVVNTKPYIEVQISKSEGSSKNMHLMIDTGASHAILLDNTDDDSLLPDQNITSVIGRGIGGPINGYLGRMRHVKIGRFEFDEAIASFPIEGDYGQSIKRGSRNGTIGGEVISRFNVTFDYFRGYLYLKPSRTYHQNFEHDMSGMNISTEGVSLKKMKINDVRIGSPAYNAGLRSGDEILTINGYDLKEIEFSGITGMLRNRPGKKIVVKYIRGGESQKTTFKLARYI